MNYKLLLKRLAGELNPARVYSILRKVPCSLCGQMLAHDGQVLGHPFVNDGLCLDCTRAANEVEDALRPKIATWNAQDGWAGSNEAIAQAKSMMPSYRRKK